jgi:epoxyqueuosine reductase QueG
MQSCNADSISSFITELVDTSPENSLVNPANHRAFDSPLVGFSSGDDPLYRDFKTHVGPFHWTPVEVFELAFPNLKAKASEISIISWVLPQTMATRKDNRGQDRYPAESWARNRIFGEDFNVKLAERLVEYLEREGHEAVNPVSLPEWKVQPSERFTYASNWSERHAAYASGLGTFGLCDGLITAKGKAVRLGSVAARIVLTPTARPYGDRHEYCLFYSTGACVKCVERCPVQAVSIKGHDKLKCRLHAMIDAADYVKLHYGFYGYGCGLCQTGVPCESRIPGQTGNQGVEIKD